MHEVTLIPGDGVGPEITAAARVVLDAVTSEIAWDEVHAGERPFQSEGTPLPHEVFASLERTGLGLKGPLTNPGTGYPSPTRELRKAFNLWCNVRIGESVTGARTRFPGVKLTVIRDTTEDLLAGVEQWVGPDAGVAIRSITRSASARLARFACAYAIRNGDRLITVPNQATSLRITDGLFVTEVLAEARAHTELTATEETLDALLMHLVQDPTRYQVLVAPNFYGGFLCGLCAGLTGGVGLMAGGSWGDGAVTLFEPAHGTAPRYAGLNKVNPAAMILSGVLLLQQIGLTAEADRVRAAVLGVLADGTDVTYDQGGSASTKQMAEAIVRRLDA
jgi:isocitrate dehydrogenase (NAD+)